MTALGPKLVPEESELIPPVLDAVLALPDKCHVAVRYTGIRYYYRLEKLTLTYAIFFRVADIANVLFIFLVIRFIGAHLSFISNKYRF